MAEAIWRLIAVLLVVFELVACSGTKETVEPEAAVPQGPALLVFYTDG